AGSLGIGNTTANALTLGRSGITTTFGSTAWTATPTISGLITATSGLTANGLLTANSNFTLGDNGETGSIDTIDWDISTTGVLSGISGITTDGGYTQSGATQNTFSGNVDATAGLDITGTSLTVGGSNASITTAGVITGTTINSTGAIQTGGTDRISSGGNLVNIGTITASGLFTANGGATIASGQDLRLAGLTTDGGLLYTNGSGVVGQSTAGGAGQVLQSNGSGAPSWVDASSIGINYWDRSNGVISPKIAGVHDLLLGSNATGSAKFGFINVNSGTPTASISANTANNAAYLTGDGTLATTNRGTLTLGNSSTYNTTGNVLINPNGTGNVGIGTTAPIAKLHVAANATNAFAVTNTSNAEVMLVDTSNTFVRLNGSGAAADADLSSGTGALQIGANNSTN
ncbi:MAG: beta strand repeat-containing protein, partial [Acidobacteriota bacterium]